MSKCEPCQTITECLQFPIAFYNLNVGKHYSNPLLGFQVVQPDGSVLTVYVPPGTVNVDFPFPPDVPTDYPPVVLQCPNGGTIVQTIPPGSTQAQIDAIIAQMIFNCAQSIANQPPPGPPPPNPQTNDLVFFNHPCPGGTLTLSVSPPSWITLDAVNSRLVGAAGTFTSNSKASANAIAQAAIDGWGNQQLGLGTLTCVSSSGCGTLPTLRDSKTDTTMNSTVAFQRGGTLFIEAGSNLTNAFYNLRDIRDMNVINTNALGVRNGPPFGGFCQSSGKWAFVDLDSSDFNGIIRRVTIGAGTTSPTAAPFVIPNVGNNVQIQVSSTVGFLALDTLFILGVTYSVVSVDSGVLMTIQNLTATPAGTVPSGSLVNDATGYTFTINNTAWPINLSTTLGSGKRGSWANNSNGLVYFALAGSLVCFNTATNAIVATVSPNIGTMDLNGVTVDEATGKVYACGIDFINSIGYLYEFDSSLGSFVQHALPNSGNIGNVNSPVFSPSTGLVYVPTEDNSSNVVIYAINPSTGAADATIPVPTGFSVILSAAYSSGGYDFNTDQAYFAIQSNVTFGVEAYVICTTTNTLLGLANTPDAFATAPFFSYEDHFKSEITARNNGGTFQVKLERYSP
jgi:hypothetical protein